jgi:hypothetical protein
MASPIKIATSEIIEPILGTLDDHEDRIATTELKTNTNSRDIKQIEQTINVLNPNNNDEITISTENAITPLPATAPEMGMKSKAEGLTIDQKIINGDFSSTSFTSTPQGGWARNISSSGISIISGGITNNRLNIVASNDEKFGFQEANGSSGDVWFVRGYFQRNSGAGALVAVLPKGATTGAITTPVSTAVFDATPVNAWTYFSAFVTATNDGITILCGRNSATTYEASFDNIMATNLTASGLTALSTSQLDALTTDYFEGTQSAIVPSFKSVGKNLFDNNKKLFGTTGTVFYHPITTGLRVYNTTAQAFTAIRYEYKVTVGKSYRLSCFVTRTTGGASSNRVFVSRGSSGASTVAESASTGAITLNINSIDVDTIYIWFYATAGTSQIADISYTDIMLEEGTVKTTHEPYKESYQFAEPNIIRSLPNGVKDSDDGDYTQRVSGEYVLKENDFISLIKTGINKDWVTVSKSTTFPLASQWSSSTVGDILTIFKEVTTSNASEFDTSDGLFTVGTGSTQFFIFFPKGTYNDITAARAALAGNKIIYKLATPITTLNTRSGNLFSYPRGTVYAVPYLPDADVYTDKFTLSRTAYPIKSLVSLVKYNPVTGTETQLNIATAVIAGDKLSFTHPNLTSGDWVFLIYERSDNLPKQFLKYLYKNGKDLVIDSVNSKVYRLVPTVASGVVTWTTVEVT